MGAENFQLCLHCPLSAARAVRQRWETGERALSLESQKTRFSLKPGYGSLASLQRVLRATQPWEQFSRLAVALGTMDPAPGPCKSLALTGVDALAPFARAALSEKDALSNGSRVFFVIQSQSTAVVRILSHALVSASLWEENHPTSHPPPTTIVGLSCSARGDPWTCRRMVRDSIPKDCQATTHNYPKNSRPASRVNKLPPAVEEVLTTWSKN